VYTIAISYVDDQVAIDIEQDLAPYRLWVPLVIAASVLAGVAFFYSIGNFMYKKKIKTISLDSLQDDKTEKLPILSLTPRTTSQVTPPL
jgi:hypothetical protein